MFWIKDTWHFQIQTKGCLPISSSQTSFPTTFPEDWLKKVQPKFTQPDWDSLVLRSQQWSGIYKICPPLLWRRKLTFCYSSLSLSFSTLSPWIKGTQKDTERTPESHCSMHKEVERHLEKLEITMKGKTVIKPAYHLYWLMDKLK